MAVIRVNTDPADRHLRSLAVALLVGAWIAAPRIDDHGHALAAAMVRGVALALAVSGMVRPAWIRPIHRILLCVSMPLMWVVSHSIMLVLYFALITPIALVARACGYDPLSTRFRRDRPRWSPAADGRPLEHSFRQY